MLRKPLPTKALIMIQSSLTRDLALQAMPQIKKLHQPRVPPRRLLQILMMSQTMNQLVDRTTTLMMNKVKVTLP